MTKQTFTASNGVTIHLEESAMPVYSRPATGTPISPEERMQALREYFTAERDEQLGRWRDSETGLLVYPAGEIRDRHYQHRAVHVLDEELVTTRLIHEGDIDSPRLAKHEEVQAAARYFAAHPESKPWHDAQSGELWLLTINGEQVGALAWRPAPGPTFETATGTLRHDDPDITAGRRIWPEQETDDE